MKITKSWYTRFAKDVIRLYKPQQKSQSIQHEYGDAISFYRHRFGIDIHDCKIITANNIEDQSVPIMPNNDYQEPKE